MTAPAPGEAKPNILFIMGDDIGWMQPTRRRYGTRTGRCTSPWCPMHRQGSSLA
jgi:arylsulfatase A-like enzyme